MCKDHRNQLPSRTQENQKKGASEARYDGGGDGGGAAQGAEMEKASKVVVERAVGAMEVEVVVVEMVSAVCEGGAMKAVEAMEEAETVVEAMEVVVLLVARVAEVTT